MKRRHLFSFFACAPLLAGLLLSSGCGDKGADKDGTAVTSPAPGSTPGGKADTGAGPDASGKKLVIAWAEWEPAKQLETLTKDFTQETGIPVEIQQIPWSDFENKVKLAWSAQDPIL